MKNRKYVMHLVRINKEEVEEHLQNAKNLLTACLASENLDNLEALIFQLNEINKIVNRLKIEIHSMEFVLKELEEN